MDTKICSKCCKEKPLSEFSKSKLGRLGRRSQCKQCDADYKIINRERIANYQKEYNKRYRIVNKEHLKELTKAYLKTPKGKFYKSRANHNYRSNLENTGDSISFEQWNKIIEMQGNRCVICGKFFSDENPATIDHIISVAQGGNFSYENIQALCRSCNSLKSGRIDKTCIVSWGIY